MPECDGGARIASQTVAAAFTRLPIHRPYQVGTDSYARHVQPCMNENIDEAAEFTERVMGLYRDYMAREQAWWEFLRTTGLVSADEAAWVLWGRSRRGDH